MSKKLEIIYKLWYQYLTDTENESVQIPPPISVDVVVGPSIANISKSNLK